MKIIASTLCAACLLLSLAGCNNSDTSGALPDTGTAPENSSIEPAPAPDQAGYALGEEVESLFFTFTVLSAEAVESYAGLSATPGSRLVDVVIRTTNTFGAEIPMVDYDYQIQWGEPSDTTAFAYPLDAADDSMAPLERSLADGESMEYHYIYEVPEEESLLLIAYQERYITVEGAEGEGSAYFVAFSI